MNHEGNEYFLINIQSQIILIKIKQVLKALEIPIDYGRQSFYSYLLGRPLRKRVTLRIYLKLILFHFSRAQGVIQKEPNYEKTKLPYFRTKKKQFNWTLSLHLIQCLSRWIQKIKFLLMSLIWWTAEETPVFWKIQV